MRPKSPKLNTCDRCHSELPLGSTQYKVRIEITSDFDGYLPDMDESDQLQSQILTQLAQLDEQTLEDQVHMELNLTLCPACRARFLEDLELATEGKQPQKSKQRIRLH